VRNGNDGYLINGQKIWTSGAQNADWIFCLVRTNPQAAKHDGISFILFDLKSPGVTIQPIRLISGASSFCQVFFENVRAKASNLIGQENAGWTIAKRLLQYERSMLSGGQAPAPAAPLRQGAAGPRTLGSIARSYLGEQDGRIADPLLRERVAQLEMDALCFALTTRRSAETSRATQGPNHTASVFKLYSSEMAKRRQELLISIMGSQGLGWEGDTFSAWERGTTRQWLRSKGNTIEGGTSEVQLNVIAKRVLELPD
jgi:alkylation response protein AidB-like acyl-CoA dehydrogenase